VGTAFSNQVALRPDQPVPIESERTTSDL